MNNWFDLIKEKLESLPVPYEVVMLVVVPVLAYLSYIVVRRLIFGAVRKAVSKTKTEWDDLLLNDKFLNRLTYFVPLYIIDLFTDLFPAIDKPLSAIIHALMILFILLAISQFLNGVTSLLEKASRFKDKPIKGYIQVIKIIIFVWGGILIVGVISNQDPWTIMGGLSALTAVIILVFRDTILSFVASIQISSYDLVKKGDWIEVPKYGADGDVIDISLNIIKVQNWDKTITVIPTYKLIDDSFKNWRGMIETGGRRIKRSIFIDQSSVKFADEQMLEKYSKIELIKDYVKSRKEEIEKFNKEKGFDTTIPVNGRRMTNIGTFREYLKAYLKQREDIHKGLTFLVRQLQPGANGIPIEIYVFATTTAWVEYEEIQGHIFDHILAVIPEFDLRIFQYPSGHDFSGK